MMLSWERYGVGRSRLLLPMSRPLARLLALNHHVRVKKRCYMALLTFAIHTKRRHLLLPAVATRYGPV